MLSALDSLRDITLFTVIVRMVAAFLLGGAIGVERSYKNRPAGFRTHILVCTGATIASMTGIYLYINLHFPTDLSRLGAQVVSGLGFIGGGTIIITKKKTIKGLTTAAGLWTTGIIGLAIGAGFYEGAVIAEGALLIIETVFADFGSKIKQKPEFHLKLVYSQKSSLDDLLRFCKDHRFSITNLQVTGSSDSDEPVYTAMISLRSRKFDTADNLITHSADMDGVVSIESIEPEQLPYIKNAPDD